MSVTIRGACGRENRAVTENADKGKKEIDKNREINYYKNIRSSGLITWPCPRSRRGSVSLTNAVMPPNAGEST